MFSKGGVIIYRFDGTDFKEAISQPDMHEMKILSIQSMFVDGALYLTTGGEDSIFKEKKLNFAR
jgi:hypothetical protein